MLVDVRMYRVKPGKLSQELDLYAKHGLAAQIRHLGAPLALRKPHAGLAGGRSFSPSTGRPLRWDDGADRRGVEALSNPTSVTGTQSLSITRTENFRRDDL